MDEIEYNGWESLYQLAKEDSDLRKIAIIRGYSWVDHAFNASGVRLMNISIAKKILIAKGKGLLDSTLTEDVLRTAIQARFFLHEGRIPDNDQCAFVINVFHEIWLSLKKQIVNYDVAKKIAEEILTKRNISSVAIYGSLARANTSPGDIDFLIFDDGTYSEDNREGPSSERAYQDAEERTASACKLLKLSRFEYHEIVKCGWVDITIVNRLQLGVDQKYTQDIISHQPDPYFFFNISVDLLDYSDIEKQFIPSKNPFFQELRRVKTEYLNLINPKR